MTISYIDDTCGGAAAAWSSLRSALRIMLGWRPSSKTAVAASVPPWESLYNHVLPWKLGSKLRQWAEVEDDNDGAVKYQCRQLL